MLATKLVTITTLEGTEITFECSRLFGITAPFKDEKSGEQFDCVVALRTIEPDKVALIAVKESADDIRYRWDRALLSKAQDV